MDDWIIRASAERRDEVLWDAARARLIRRALRGKPHPFRAALADSALALSRALADFAHTVRAKA